MNRVWLLLAATCLSAQMSFATNIDWSQIRYNIQDSVTLKKDQATIEADYLKRVEKDRIKEKYGRESGADDEHHCHDEGGTVVMRPAHQPVVETGSGIE